MLGTFTLLSHSHKTDSGYVILVLNSLEMRKLRSDLLSDEQQERRWPGDGSSDPQVSRYCIHICALQRTRVRFLDPTHLTLGFPGGSVVMNLPVNAGDTGDSSSIPGLERSS